MDAAELERLYGRWTQRTPHDVLRLFAGYTGTWWIAGGWALEAFTGVPRRHGDIDPCVLREELPALRRHLAGRLDAWAAFQGALKPLDPAERPRATAEEILPVGCNQLWTRPDAQHPWEYDILLAPGTSEEWIYRRHPSIRMPIDRALWSRGGVQYLQPEIQLLYKAPGLRQKDQADFDTTLPHLDDDRREWLRAALMAAHPQHPWLARLA